MNEYSNLIKAGNSFGYCPVVRPILTKMEAKYFEFTGEYRVPMWGECVYIPKPLVSSSKKNISFITDFTSSLLITPSLPALNCADFAYMLDLSIDNGKRWILKLKSICKECPTHCKPKEIVKEKMYCTYCRRDTGDGCDVCRLRRYDSEGKIIF